MFNKLSFDELSKIYGAISDLEKHYGHEKTMEAVKAMSDKLDHETDGIPKPQKSGSIQLEFFDKPQRKKRGGYTRTVTHKETPGENDRKIREYFVGFNPENEILRMYYHRGMTQSEIGQLIGVNQRAVSKFINEIPEEKRAAIKEGGTK